MKANFSLRRLEAVPWLLIAVLFVALSVLIGATIANFTSVAETHGRATLSIRSSVEYKGLSTSGILAGNGSVTFTIFFDVDNPTSRSLAFFTIGYRVWLEDAPAEAHLVGTGRTPQDVPVTNSTGTRWFYLAFDGSLQTQPVPVSAFGNATLPLVLKITNASDPGRYAVIQNITQYAVHVLGGTSLIVWNVWSIVSLDIGGIPPPSSNSEAPYFTQISRVQFTEGVDFGLGEPVTHA